MESGLLFGNKWELEYSQRFPKAGNGNGNEVMEMEGNGYTKVIPAHLYCGLAVDGRQQAAATASASASVSSSAAQLASCRRP